MEYQSKPFRDAEYVKEMNRRFKELETGKVKSYTLDEVEVRAKQAYKAGKVK